jgi:hypothetical protein
VSAVEKPRFAIGAIAARLGRWMRSGGGPMLTKPLIFGFNLVTLAGFAVMAAGYNVGRVGRTMRGRAPVGFALMGIGTALVFLGLYLDLGGGPR